MPTHLVNLDALILREDFESSVDSPRTKNQAEIFKIEELEKNRLFFRNLRKPDFQRETANWSPEMILDFVTSYLDGDVIPSIIMWHSKKSGKLFVIDGAHRISALIAWVNDDYGDQDISRPFFRNQIPAAQKKLASRTRELIDEKLGSYKKLYRAGLNPDEAENETVLLRGRNIANLSMTVQWVEGEAEAAERSFFKINGNPATIDPTELDIIQARRKPNAIATRAIIRAGTGHRYWAKFSEDKITEIERLAHNVFNLLFGPMLEFPIKTLDVPVAGQAYSGETFKMILDMVNTFNDVTPSMWQHKDIKPIAKNTKSFSIRPLLDDDLDGSATIAFLERIMKVGRLVSSPDYAGSLGLDQAVYSYGATGKFHPAAFLASLKFAQQLERENAFERFTNVRADFEEFLVRHKSFINQLGHSKGSRTRALDALVTMHQVILKAMLDGLSEDDQVVARLQENPKLKDLKNNVSPEDDEFPIRKTFSKSAQAAALLREILNTRSRCKICGARQAPAAMSKDHIKRVEDGGLGEAGNLQWTHRYCNSGYKEAKHAKTSKKYE